MGAIAPKLEQAEIERSRRKPTGNLDAYDYFLRGMAAYQLWTEAANKEAMAMFTQAIERDPDFASAYAMAARCHVQHKAGGWPAGSIYDVAETVRLARRAAALGMDDAFALCMAGFALAWVGGEVEEGAALVESALKLNPNLSAAWLYGGWVKVWLGEPDVAIERIDRAKRLSPQDPLLISMNTASASANLFAGSYAEAWSLADAAVRQRPNYGFPLIVAAASAALAGRRKEAEQAMVHMRHLMPQFRVASLSDFFPLRRAEDIRTFSEGLRMAGLPE